MSNLKATGDSERSLVLPANLQLKPIRIFEVQAIFG